MEWLEAHPDSAHFTCISSEDDASAPERFNQNNLINENDPIINNKKER